MTLYTSAKVLSNYLGTTSNPTPIPNPQLLNIHHDVEKSPLKLPVAGQRRKESPLQRLKRRANLKLPVVPKKPNLEAQQPQTQNSELQSERGIEGNAIPAEEQSIKDIPWTTRKRKGNSDIESIQRNGTKRSPTRVKHSDLPHDHRAKETNTALRDPLPEGQHTPPRPAGTIKQNFLIILIV